MHLNVSLIKDLSHIKIFSFRVIQKQSYCQNNQWQNSQIFEHKIRHCLQICLSEMKTKIEKDVYMHFRMNECWSRMWCLRKICACEPLKFDLRYLNLQLSWQLFLSRLFVSDYSRPQWFNTIKYLMRYFIFSFVVVGVIVGMHIQTVHKIRLIVITYFGFFS